MIGRIILYLLPYISFPLLSPTHFLPPIFSSLLSPFPAFSIFSNLSPFLCFLLPTSFPSPSLLSPFPAFSPSPQDTLQLSHVVQCLVAQRGKETTMEPEFFQYLLLILVSIGKARPRNLLLISALVEDKVACQILVEHNKDGEKTQGSEAEVREMFKSLALVSDTTYLYCLCGYVGLVAGRETYSGERR